MNARAVLVTSVTTGALAISAAGVPVTTSSAAAPPAPASLAAKAAAKAAAPSVGASGIGDRLFPTLGNGGYDARHYSLRLRYATAKPTQGIDGSVTMRAKATQALSVFNLDFGGDSVGAVKVDGRTARFSRRGEELVITPAKAIRKGHTFRVAVQHFRSHPRVPSPENFLSTAFVATRDGSVTAGQPDNMHDVFPSNDHPRDLASFTIRFDVPSGQTAVANGVLTDKQSKHGRTVWTYEQRQPMATELTQLVVGRYTVIKRAAVREVDVRDVVPTRLLSQYRNRLGVVRKHLQWMQDKVGAYPFLNYGSLIAEAELGFALETQTLSLYDARIFGLPQGIWDPVMVHELSHQWFGDSVAPDEWSDVWQNEGHASWYEFTYAAENGYLKEDTGFTNHTKLMKAIYSAADQFRFDFGPVARPLSGDANALFNPNVYYGGALVLFALRQRIGTAAFDRVERAWVTRYRGRSASTDDFIQLATEVSGKPDVDQLLRTWLYGRSTPPMPGHPDWTVAPVRREPAAAAARVLPLTPLRSLLKH